MLITILSAPYYYHARRILQVVNTIGFYNRKFFMLFLVYANLTLAFSLIAIGAQMPDLIPWATSTEAKERYLPGVFNVVVIVAAMILDVVLLALLIPFMTVHLRMAAKNESTIDGAPCKVACTPTARHTSFTAERTPRGLRTCLPQRRPRPNPSPSSQLPLDASRLSVSQVRCRLHGQPQAGLRSQSSRLGAPYVLHWPR